MNDTLPGSSLVAPNRMRFDTPPPSRERILEIQDMIAVLSAAVGQNLEVTQTVCPVTHHWAPGLYARECYLPVGAAVVGKIHKHSHINTISQGVVLVATEFGIEAIRAPCTFVSVPGSKRVVFVLETTIWTTYHPTDKTTVEEVEAEIIAPAFDALDQEYKS